MKQLSDFVWNVVSNFHLNMLKKGIIHLVCSYLELPERLIFFSPVYAQVGAYEGVRNVSFSKNYPVLRIRVFTNLKMFVKIRSMPLLYLEIYLEWFQILSGLATR